MKIINKRYSRSPLFLALIFALFSPSLSWGIINIGSDLELEGFVQAQNIVRTPKFKDAELIMQRNTAQLESKYYFLRDSKAFGRFNTGRLEQATLTLVGRAVYDSVYDMRDSYQELGSEREFKLREAFVDLVLPPFTLRLGRQQVVWGETDNFRALDVINPLDLSWHWGRESWEDIRIPLWMARGIWDIGKIAMFEESFLELVWIPQDFQPNKIETDARRPWAVTGAGLVQNANSILIGGALRDLDLTIRDQRPDNNFDNGQIGVRFKAIWGDIDFSLNYFSGYSATAGFKSRNALSFDDGTTFHAVLDQVYPRTNVLGVTANYSEEKYTQAVFRLESTYTTGVPVSIRPGAPLNVDPDGDGFDTVDQTVVMIGMDRPTWIKALNKRRTFFISTQFFWRRYMDFSSHYRGLPSVRQAVVGGVAIPGRFVSENRDKLNRDDFVMTLAASTAYGAAGLLKPSLVFAYDPRSTGGFTSITAEYLLSNHLTLKAQQYIYWQGKSNPGNPGPWAVGDIWGRPGDSRHETIFTAILSF